MDPATGRALSSEVLMRSRVLWARSLVPRVPALQSFPLGPPGEARLLKWEPQDCKTLNQTKASIISVIMAAVGTCV